MSSTRCFGDVNERVDIGIKALDVLGRAEDTSLRDDARRTCGRHATRRRPEYIHLATQWRTHGSRLEVVPGSGYSANAGWFGGPTLPLTRDPRSQTEPRHSVVS